MMKRLSSALLLVAVACGPLPPAESSPAADEREVLAEPPATQFAVPVVPGAPRASVRGGGSIEGARMDHADVTMGELRKRMRGCYQQALTQHPTEAGSYAFTMSVDAQGSVTSADGKGQGSLSPETLACLSGVMNSTRFAAPEGPSATVKGQFTFSPTRTATP